MNRWYLGSITMLLGAASYGISGPFAKLAFRDGLSLGDLVPSLFFVSSLTFSIILLFNRRRFEGITKKNVWQLAGMGGSGLGATVCLYYFAISQLPVSVAIVLLFQFAWIVPVINIIVNRRWPNIFVILSLIFIVAGTVLAVDLKWGFWREGTILGYAAGILSAFCYAIYLHYNAVIATNVSALTRSTVMTFGGLIVALIVYPPFFLFNGRLLDVGGWAILSGVFSQIFPTILMAIGIPLIGGVLSAILGAIELPVSVLSSNFFLDEPITIATWLGIALILLGITVGSVLGYRKVGKVRTKSKLKTAEISNKT
jgi:drug/metabolite transporter (DMT)-like permease